MTKIYLSSTYNDLKACREAVYHVLRQMRHDVVAMEDYVASDERPTEKCLADVAASELYIGIFAWRYGYIPSEMNPEHKSITELEYRKAIQTGKTCLLFLLDEEASWSRKLMDEVTGEGKRGKYIAALRRELAQGKIVSFFQTPEELSSLVSTAVNNWEKNRTLSDTSNSSVLIQKKHAENMERKVRLRAMLADHSSFMYDRLSSFVGRKKELAEIFQRIAEKQQTGGYVTITGQAGQGKSSIIAKLVEEYGSENVAFHFIPFNPGPDHQVGLLRNLMAHLILKYNLSDLYVASESRSALRDYFPKVLEELVSKGGQEVILIDGLDQLEEDATGIRDLSFLPNNPPPYVVFVLGTRPNDTLRPLELLKPYHEYKLPNLSRVDFDLILNHRKVHLNGELTDRFYEAMQENALYLDLVAKELVEVGAIGLVEVIKRVTDNPNNIFSLSMARFKRQPNQWREVIKPVLGVLLTTREPLAVRNIRQIIGVEEDWLKEGLVRLGGLIARDGQQRCYLFHLKLRDYLQQDESNPDKEYIFATDEQESWHARLAEWCKGNDLSVIWQDIKGNPAEQGRREYAKRYYVTHLYWSHEWQQLFALLDAGTYGRTKVQQYDPSTRSYAQDLYLGRLAAAFEGETIENRLILLPNLWRYTLLQCSLTSRADRYTPEMFQALLLLKHDLEAWGLAELLTKPDYKARVLLQLAKYLGKQQTREQEYLQLLMRSLEITDSVDDPKIKSKILHELCIEYGGPHCQDRKTG